MDRRQTIQGLAAILAVLLALSGAAMVAAQEGDGRINEAAHFGGDALYCVDRDGNPTHQYSDDGLGGMELLNISGNSLWFVPADDIGAAVEAAQATPGTGVLIATGVGTYGPTWLFTYIDSTGNVKFVFTGHDEHGKLNSLEFTYCNPVEAGPSSAPDDDSDDEDEDDEPLQCPVLSSPDGTGEETDVEGCFCPGDLPIWNEGECQPMAQDSDVAIKENFQSVDPQAVLARVAELPISQWNYISDANDTRHIGPMAQDFLASFGVGDDPTRINFIDANGVNLAATQGLYQLVTAQQAQIEALEQSQRQTTGLAVAAALLAGAMGGAVVMRRRKG